METLESIEDTLKAQFLLGVRSTASCLDGLGSKMGVVQKPLCRRLDVFIIVLKSLSSTSSFRISPCSFSMKLVRSWFPC